MTNSEKYIHAFCEALCVGPDQLEGLEYKGVSEWDSVGHMGLIAALETAFGIEMDSEDIIDLDSFNKGKEILKKYDVEF